MSYNLCLINISLLSVSSINLKHYSDEYNKISIYYSSNALRWKKCMLIHTKRSHGFKILYKCYMFFIKKIEMAEAHWKIGKIIFKKWEMIDFKVFRSLNKISFAVLEKISA